MRSGRDKIAITVSRDSLAHCRDCLEPLYCIYDQRLRDFCHDCEKRMGDKYRRMIKLRGVKA